MGDRDKRDRRQRRRNDSRGNTNEAAQVSPSLMILKRPAQALSQSSNTPPSAASPPTHNAPAASSANPTPTILTNNTIPISIQQRQQQQQQQQQQHQPQQQTSSPPQAQIQSQSVPPQSPQRHTDEKKSSQFTAPPRLHSRTQERESSTTAIPTILTPHRRNADQPEYSSISFALFNKNMTPETLADEPRFQKRIGVIGPLSVVAVIGPECSGKSTIASHLFRSGNPDPITPCSVPDSLPCSYTAMAAHILSMTPTHKPQPHETLGSHEPTSGIHVLANSQGTIVLDTQPLLSTRSLVTDSSVPVTASDIPVFMQSLHQCIFTTLTSDVIVLVLSYPLCDDRVFALLEASETIRPNQAPPPPSHTTTTTTSSSSSTTSTTTNPSHHNQHSQSTTSSHHHHHQQQQQQQSHQPSSATTISGAEGSRASLHAHPLCPVQPLPRLVVVVNRVPIDVFATKETLRITQLIQNRLADSGFSRYSRQQIEVHFLPEFSSDHQNTAKTFTNGIRSICASVTCLDPRPLFAPPMGMMAYGYGTATSSVSTSATTSALSLHPVPPPSPSASTSTSAATTTTGGGVRMSAHMPQHPASSSSSLLSLSLSSEPINVIPTCRYMSLHQWVSHATRVWEAQHVSGNIRSFERQFTT